MYVSMLGISAQLNIYFEQTKLLWFNFSTSAQPNKVNKQSSKKLR